MSNRSAIHKKSRSRRVIDKTINFLCFIFALILTSTVSGQETEEKKPNISAEAAVLMDQESQRVLYHKNMEQRRPIASTTKIMTAILAIEEGDLQSKVEVSEKAAGTGGSSVWLEADEEKNLEELIYGLMLRSGNDAAVAIAEHLGGSVEEFARMMTHKAREIGATETLFKNPHGLHHEEHYSTAYDLGLITSYAMNNQDFSRISSAPWAKISWPGQEWERVLRNQNQLLDSYQGADGVKTGWTTPAGRCFVGSATRDDWQLVAVVLNAPDMWEDAMRLLDYGFDEYQKEKLVCRSQVVKTVEVKRSRQERAGIKAIEDFSYPLKPEEKNKIRYLFSLNEAYTAPLHTGDIIGEMKMLLDGKTIGSVKLTVTEDVPRSPFYEPLVKYLRRLFLD